MKPQSQTPRRVVIAGGGVAGWMTAAGLVRALDKRNVVVRVIDLPGEDDLPYRFGASALPPLRNFHAILGLDEASLMRIVRATFKLGTEFRDWRRKGDSYIHPFGVFGAGMDGVSFHHFWLQQRKRGAGQLGEYSLPALAAQLGKFTMPVSDPSSVLSTLGYSYHLDPRAYARVLRDYSERSGVARTEADIRDVTLNERGHVQSLLLSNGETVEGELFVDCSGARAVLIEGALKTPYEDWSQSLPCDRLIETFSAIEERAPITRITARDAGWSWAIPLQTGVSQAYCYSSAHISDDAAAATLRAAAGDGEQRALRWRNGRRAHFWSKNVVAIGASAANIDPLESTPLHTLQSSVIKLVGLFPNRDWDPDRPGETSEYNRLMGSELERIRDLIVLHYKANERDGDFWRACAAIEPSGALAQKMTLFAARGRVLLFDDETFLEPSWLSVFIGQGIMPRAYDPLADAVDPDVIASAMSNMRGAIRRAAEEMPPHGAFLSRFLQPQTPRRMSAADGAR